MRLIISGSRTLRPTIEEISDMIKFDSIDVKIVISGGAKGVDRCGELYAESVGLPVEIFEADWDTFGKSAGPKRNKEMAKYADVLLLIWDGKSKGSANMKNEMIKLGKPIFEYNYAEGIYD